MASENQHWVPKLLLKEFVDADGKAFLLDIHSGEVKKRPPKWVAAAEGFNELEINGETVSYEDRLEKIETKAAPVIQRIIGTQSLASLTDKDRKKISDFVAAQSFRTQAFFEGLKDKPSRKDYGPLFETLWQSAFILSEMIERRRWALMVIAGNDVFYLGDHPVVLQNTRNPKDGSNLGFDVPGIEVLMPLSPKRALYMPCHTVSSEIIANYDAAIATHRAVRLAVLNGSPGGTGELISAQDTIRRSDELYQAFRTGSPIIAKMPHIENLNYLQCSWAHKFVFSNKRDFAFARHVFKNSPQYRETPKVGILRKTALVADGVDPIARSW